MLATVLLLAGKFFCGDRVIDIVGTQDGKDVFGADVCGGNGECAVVVVGAMEEEGQQLGYDDNDGI